MYDLFALPLLAHTAVLAQETLAPAGAGRAAVEQVRQSPSDATVLERAANAKSIRVARRSDSDSSTEEMTVVNKNGGLRAETVQP